MLLMHHMKNVIINPDSPKICCHREENRMKVEKIWNKVALNISAIKTMQLKMVIQPKLGKLNIMNKTRVHIMRSKKKTTALIRRLILILASLETNKIQEHFSRYLQIFWGSRLFVFSQGCSRYGGCLQRASQMVCSPQCLTSGVTASSSTRWSPLAAFPFKASLTIRSLNKCLFIMVPGMSKHRSLIISTLKKCDLTTISFECPLEEARIFNWSCLPFNKSQVDYESRSKWLTYG